MSLGNRAGLARFRHAAVIACLCLTAWATATIASPEAAVAVTTNPARLFGVSATSPTDAFTVGTYQTTRTNSLIEHWDGSAWSQTTSSSPGPVHNGFDAVSALSPSDAWAVGGYVNSVPHARTLIDHWDGTAWSKVKSPNPNPYSDELSGVAAVSSTDVWAVGSAGYSTPAGAKTLIEHWDGTAWSPVSSPAPGTASSLTAVSATSATDAWAVGTSDNNTLILHWDGTAWSQVTGPGLGSGGQLSGVSATSTTDAWAVGTSGNNTLILHWDGTAWSQVSSPSPDLYGNVLYGVGATSASDAWAVGYANPKVSGFRPQTLVLHWDGTAWSQVTSPNPGPVTDVLYGVTATSAADAWAVGYYHDPTTRADQTLTLHWDGATWSKVKDPKPGG